MACSNNLRFVSNCYCSSGAGTSDGAFLNCGTLSAISIPVNSNTFIGNYSIGAAHYYNGCSSLKRVKVGATYANMFDYCINLEEVEISGASSLAWPEMNYKFAMLMTATTPPTISATSPVWGTKPIYVPDEAVEAYKTADGWSNAVDYIYPASQYPDN